MEATPLFPSAGQTSTTWDPTKPPEQAGAEGAEIQLPSDDDDDDDDDEAGEGVKQTDVKSQSSEDSEAQPEGAVGGAAEKKEEE